MRDNIREVIMCELDVKKDLRAERDRLLEIKRVCPPEATEAIRLIDQRLETIRETLEDCENSTDDHLR